MGLIFDEATLYNGNIFKYEGRLKSAMNKYTDSGSILTNYFAQDENSSTVDRGLQDIEELFGKNAPLRYSEIQNFPISGLLNTNPENTDERQIEDINIEGEATILPSTIIPKPYDFFIIPHVKQDALFIVKAVQYDSLKPEGFYKIQYKLFTTSHEKIQNLRQRVVQTYHMDLNYIGTSQNPIITEEDHILRGKIEHMTYKMISAYRALFYNDRHNCFLYHDPETGIELFDLCGNEFIAKYSLMNYPGSASVLVLHEKLQEPKFPLYYNKSIYNWLELGAPVRLLQKFNYITMPSYGYIYSTFAQWREADKIHVIYPLALDEQGVNTELSIFDDEQFDAFLKPTEGYLNEYDSLIWKFINKPDISINDISLFTGDTLLNSMDHWNIFIYTPIIIYIIRHILQMQ